MNLSPESWGRAEKAIQKIIFKIQPTNESEERRKEVVEYVQRLVRTCFGCEVFPYGSVPLKTYLPDGDIDLTAFGGVTSDDGLAEDVVYLLEGEEHNNAQFIVKNVQLIPAEVKLVKCIVDNIVVDISFNQIGGVSTLCFLEQVDRLIGKEHLFKRSIILVKAWCYYESRILGAYHGLISTYALETLVLYIFHLFHSSLNGPLAVLYKFMDYFSKFDWDNYCISLSGPVRLASLPEFVVETPDNGGGSLLLSDEFLGRCFDMFSVPLRGVDLSFRTFQQKHLNIVDPLKENNNLGRSVKRGNFYRIRSAFTYGARKLGQILMEAQDDIDEGLRKFFFNTLDRHGRGQRPDVQGPLNVYHRNGFGHVLVASEAESCLTEKVIPETGFLSWTRTVEDCRSDHDMKASEGESNYRNNNEEQDGNAGILPSKMLAEADQPKMGKALDDRTFGDAKDLATSRLERLEISDEFSEHQDPVADLIGDYDSHFHSLLYGWACSQYDLGMAAWPMIAPPPPPFQMMNSRDGAQQSSQFMQNGFSHVGMNGVVPSPGFYNVSPFLIPGVAFGLEEMPKTRGTGTYFPHMNRPLQGYRPPSARGRNQAPSRPPRNNNRNVMFMENNVADHGIHEFSQSLVSSDQSGSKAGPSDMIPSFSPHGKLHPNANTFILQSQHGSDNSSDCRVAEAAPFERRMQRQQKPPSLTSSPQNSSPVTSPSGMQRPKPALSRDYDRLSMKSAYHLEDDFPPLSL